MPEEATPPEVAEFIAQYISSLEQLEVIMAVSQEPARAWTVADVYAVVQSNETSIGKRLAGFAAAGLLQVGERTEPPNYRFAPPSAALQDAVAATIQFYRLRPVTTIELIFGRAKAPTDPAQTFADAFKFRKD